MNIERTAGRLATTRAMLPWALLVFTAVPACGQDALRQTARPPSAKLDGGENATPEPETAQDLCADCPADTTCIATGTEHTCEPQATDCGASADALRCPCYTPLDATKTCYRPVAETPDEEARCVRCFWDSADSSCPLQEPATHFSVDCSDDRDGIYLCWLGPECEKLPR